MVHPHIRGAYALTFFAPVALIGSSPHTWGIRPGRCPPPAHVPVHPHIRGAYRRIPSAETNSYGSSPHTWGIRIFHFSYLSPVLVHPHIRGAYVIRGFDRVFSDGSSPHTWGIPPANWPARKMPRFIPTYVGHTPYSAKPSMSLSVHPHIRGAYATSSSLAFIKAGSSPHTWGILVQAAMQKIRARFIPTYVGHTLDRRKKNGWFQPLFL